MSITRQMSASMLDRTEPAFGVILEYDADVDAEGLPEEWDLPFLPPLGSTFTISIRRGDEPRALRVVDVRVDLYAFPRDNPPSGHSVFYTIKLADPDLDDAEKRAAQRVP